jgi:hypothetical protein
MPDYPRSCPKCGVETEEEGFALDRFAAAGRKSHCKACDRQRRKAYYAEHREELYAKREAVREAARQAHLAALAVEHEKRIAAAKRQHEAGVRRQRELLKSLGVPDLTPEEVSERARRRGATSIDDLHQ